MDSQGVVPTEQHQRVNFQSKSYQCILTSPYATKDHFAVISSESSDFNVFIISNSGFRYNDIWFGGRCMLGSSVLLDNMCGKSLYENCALTHGHHMWSLDYCKVNCTDAKTQKHHFEAVSRLSCACDHHAAANGY